MSYKHLSVEECKVLLKNPETHVLDIRDAQSYAAGHIEGAIAAKDFKAFMTNANKDAPLVVCCYHGNTSQGAAEQLVKQGFTNVYSLDGGYEAWENADNG
ncbi:MAG: thiosulfate sulfurtransferase GlpE [Gammaproteobacteria bacterium]|nr:MAG: thiosulfate sulfurtransferase GlpE [Gammaproteobacteria bacterium]